MRKLRVYPAITAIAVASCLFAQAQEPEDGAAGDGNGEAPTSNVQDQEDERRFWQASLPGGSYIVALDRIASVSIHEYVLDTQLVVTEMVVDTNGRALARFYHVQHVADATAVGTARRVVDRGNELLDRAGQKTGIEVKDMVQKNYPASSHAGMIEFRILDKQDLLALHGSLRRAWESGKGRRVTLK